MSDTKPRPVRVDVIVNGYRGLLHDRRVFLSPDIPPKKLHNALRTYAPDVAEGDVLALVDDTLMGSGKDGCLLTPTALYGHDAALPPVRFELAQLRSFTREAKGNHSILRADGTTVCTLTLPQPEGIDTFARLVADVSHPELATVVSATAPVPGGPEAVRLVLSHLLAAEWHRDALERTSKAFFHTFPVTVTRPGEGESVETLRCPDCGRSLDLPVFSHAALVEKMKRWGLVLLAGALVFAAGVAVAALGGDAVRESSALMVVFSTLVMVGGLGGLLGGWLLWEDYKVDRDHGVKVGEVGKAKMGYAGGWAEHSVSLAPRQ